MADARGTSVAAAAAARAAQAAVDLALPPGRPGSGLRRYAAAMWFHAAGRIDDATLETYRALALDDAADPAAVLAAERGR